MQKALVIGASGLVGTALTKQLLSNENYKEVHVFVRKPLQIQDAKLTQHVIDFDNMNRSASLLKGDVAFCCLGTTMKIAGSREAFHKVDFEYVNNFARLTFQNGVKTFAMVTAMGANAASLVFYNRTKGEIEKAVSSYGFSALYIARPSFLVGDRQTKRVGEEIGIWLGDTLNLFIPAKYKNIKAAQVAKALIASALSQKQGTHILESDVLQKF
jgi:uncharacterized protein YbjT (DUF2867 family)